MGRLRKNCGFDCGSDCHDSIDPCDNSGSREFGRGRRSRFPMDIRSLLIALAENENDETSRATLILDSCPNHCLIEDAKIIAVMGNTVVIRECEKFVFVCIGCICEVKVCCDALIVGIFEERETSRRLF